MRFSEATALTARRIELDHEPPRINVEEGWKRTDQYGRYERGGPKSLEGNRVVPIDPELAALLRPLVVLTVADRLGHDPAVLLKVYVHLIDAARNEPALAIARLLGD
jgi:integrase